MLSLSKQRNLRLLKSMIDVHGIEKFLNIAHNYRSERESRHYYTVSGDPQRILKFAERNSRSIKRVI